MKQELVLKRRLPGGWKVITLGDIADFLRGPFGSSVQKSVCVNKGQNTYKLYEQGNVINNDFKRGVYYLTEEKYKELKKFEVKAGDILITCAGTLGKIAIVPDKIEKGIINSVLMRIRLNENKILSKYFLYFFQSPSFQNRVLSKSFGGTIKNLFATKELRKFVIILPPLPEQHKIVDKLDKQMEQIKIMKTEAEKEKEAADTLFESLIKKEARLDSKDLPNGWDIYKMEEICDLKTGGTPSKSHDEYFGGKIKWMVSGDVNKEFVYDVDGRITQEGHDNSNARILPINSVLIALNGQGKTRGTVAVLKTEATCNQSIIAFIPKNKEKLDYMYLFYYLKGCYQKLRNLTGDKERSGLSMRVLKPFPIVIPPLNIQKEIIKKLEKARDFVGNIYDNVDKEVENISDLPSSILNEVFGKYEIPEEV